MLNPGFWPKRGNERSGANNSIKEFRKFFGKDKSIIQDGFAKK